MANSDSIPQIWTGGHSVPVLCIQTAGGASGLLATGAESGQVAVWSQDGTPIAQLRLPDEEDVTSAAFSPASPGHLYVSHGEAISVIDPRNAKTPLEHLKGIGEDEINALSFNDTGTMLAVADDSGAVRILDVQTGKTARTLRRHTNICSSVAFRPSRPQSLLSAGLDMQVLLWNLQKARPVWMVNLKDGADDEEEDEGHKGQPGQLFNPPLAHYVSVASCGNVFACAAEDGRLHLMRVGAGSRLEQQGAIKAHSQGASQVHFVNFLPHPYWAVSGGNDGVVALWDVTAQGLPSQAKSSNCSRPPAPRRRAKGRQRARQTQQPARLQPKAPAEGPEPGQDGGEGRAALEEECNGTGEGKEEEEGACGVGAKAKFKTGPAWSFDHKDKVNWVCPALLQGKPSILVAGQGPDVHMYSLPEL